MSTSDTLRYSDLLNRLILDRTNAEELGRVDDLWMNPQANRVLGFIYRTGTGLFANQKQAIALTQLETIGPDAIMVSGLAPADLPTESWQQAESLIGGEVWTEGGQRLGKLSDYLFDPKTGDIREYLFVPGGFGRLTDGTYTLQPEAITATGKKRVIITEAAAQQSSLHSEGLKQRLTGAVDQAKGLFGQAREKVGGQAKGLLDQARERTAGLAEQARGALDQARERTAGLADQARETLDQAREQAQEVIEQVQERAQGLAEQARGGTAPVIDIAHKTVDPAAEAAPPAVTVEPPASGETVPQPEPAPTTPADATNPESLSPGQP